MPISRLSRQVTDWDDVEQILHHTFYNELRVAPEEHPVLLALAPTASDLQREKLCQMMFETFNVPALFFADQAELAALYSGTRASSLIVNLGGDSTWAAPVIATSTGHFALAPTGMQRPLPLGGRDVTTEAQRVFTEANYEARFGFDLPLSSSWIECDYIKDRHACVAPRPGAIDGFEPITYTTCVGREQRTLTIGPEILQAAELLFLPRYGLERGIVSLIVNTLAAVDHAHRDTMLSNIVCCGGGSCLPGLAARLEYELAVAIAADARLSGAAAAAPLSPPLPVPTLVCLTYNIHFVFIIHFVSHNHQGHVPCCPTGRVFHLLHRNLFRRVRVDQAAEIRLQGAYQADGPEPEPAAAPSVASGPQEAAPSMASGRLASLLDVRDGGAVVRHLWRHSDGVALRCVKELFYIYTYISIYIVFLSRCCFN